MSADDLSRQNERDRRLGELLRAADPAVGEGLSLDETRAMRRAVLTAAPAPRRGWRAAWVPLAAGLAVLALAVTLWLGGEREDAKPPAPPRVAALPPAAIPQPPPAVSLPLSAPARAERARPPAPHRRRHVRRAPQPEAPAPPVDGGEQLAEARQIQFAAPGGTRVIWIVHPEAPAAGGR